MRRSWLIYAVVYSFFVSALALGEVRKVTRQDLEIGNPDNTVTSAGGHVGNYLSNSVATPSFVDVRDHGADNSAATDSHLALDNAIAALDDGGTLLIPQGTYLTSGELLFTGKSNITIMGYGATIKFADSFSGADVISIVSSNNIKILGLMVDGNKANQTASTNALKILNSDRTTVRDVKFVDVKYHSIYVSGSTKTLVDGCDFINGYGIAGSSDVYGSGPDDMDTATFTNCRFKRDTGTLDYADTDNSVQSFYVVGGNWRYINLTFDNIAYPYDWRAGNHIVDGSLINNCLIVMTQGYAYIKSALSKVVATNIWGGASSAGVYIITGQSTISDSYFKGKSGADYAYGLFVRGGVVAGVALSEVKVSNTTIDGADSYSIYVLATDNGAVFDKVTFKNSPVGITTETNTGNILVTDPILDNVTDMSTNTDGMQKTVGRHSSQKTINSGTASYDNVTTLIVNHGLAVTPNSFTLYSDNAVGKLWPTTATSTTFTINSDNAVVGASVYWKAERY